MTDIDHLDRLRRHFQTGEIPIARPDCLDPETVSAMADGSLGAEARTQALAHMATCAYCRRAVASVAEAVADDPVTHEIELVEGHGSRSRRMLWVAVPAAAAAVLFVVVLERNNPAQSGLPVLRDSLVADTAAQAPVLIAPRAAVDHVDQFVWSGIPRAERYRLRLYNEEGDVLWTTETADTAVAIPASVDLAPRVTYLWRVEAQTEWRKWAGSDLVEFRLGARSR